MSSKITRFLFEEEEMNIFFFKKKTPPPSLLLPLAYSYDYLEASDFSYTNGRP